MSSTTFPTWNTETISISALCHDIDDNFYNLDPEHQRNIIHSLEWKKNLIETIFTTGLIPTTYWHENNNKRESLDGKQRISTILEFKKNEFKYKGQKYDELSDEDKRHFNTFPLALGICSRTLTKEEVHNIFENLQVVKKTSLGEVLNSTYNENLKKNVLEYLDELNIINKNKNFLRKNKRFEQQEIIAWTLYFTYKKPDYDYALEQIDIKEFWNEFYLNIVENNNIYEEYKLLFNKFIRIFINNNNIPYINNKTTLIPLFYIVLNYNYSSDILEDYVSTYIDDIKNILKKKVNASHTACKERINDIIKFINENPIE
jgi:hypothetical protein